MNRHKKKVSKIKDRTSLTMRNKKKKNTEKQNPRAYGTPLNKPICMQSTQALWVIEYF